MKTAAQAHALMGSCGLFILSCLQKQLHKVLESNGIDPVGGGRINEEMLISWNAVLNREKMKQVFKISFLAVKDIGRGTVSACKMFLPLS